VPEEVALADLDARIERDDSPWYVLDRADLARASSATLDRLVEVGRRGKYAVYEEKEQDGA
jgi:hypothetical protein